MRYLRRWPVLAMLVLFVVAVINQGNSQAAYYGPVNPTFGKGYACSLSGWVTTGSVGTTSDGKNCLARLAATKDTRPNPAVETVATLEQSFTLAPTDPRITFFYSSNLGGISFRVYNGAGALIHQESITSQSGSSLVMVDRPFPGYGYAYVRVVIQVQVINPAPNTFTEQKVLIDFGITDGTLRDAPSPEPDPGGQL